MKSPYGTRSFFIRLPFFVLLPVFPFLLVHLESRLHLALVFQVRILVPDLQQRARLQAQGRWCAQSDLASTLQLHSPE